MTKLTMALSNGRSIEFEVSESGSGPSCFLLGVRKSGSTITNNICKAIAATNDRCFVELGDTFFWNNVRTREWQDDPAVAGILRPGVIYGGLRDAPVCLFGVPAFREGPKLLLVRDPRDALVSEYFSNAYSHPIPEKTGEFDNTAAQMKEAREKARSSALADYVLNEAKHFRRTLKLYLPVLEMPNTLVLKYEDVILRKAELIRAMAAHFGLAAPDAQISAILAWADVIPSEEDPRAFIRRVVPGDHVSKLSPETIAAVNTILEEPLRLFGYLGG
jgi:hypothetical protein